MREREKVQEVLFEMIETTSAVASANLATRTQGNRSRWKTLTTIALLFLVLRSLLLPWCFHGPRSYEAQELKSQ